MCQPWEAVGWGREGGRAGRIQVHTSRVVGTPKEVGDEPTGDPFFPLHLLKSSCALDCRFLWGAFLDSLAVRFPPYMQAGASSWHSPQLHVPIYRHLPPHEGRAGLCTTMFSAPGTE